MRPRRKPASAPLPVPDSSNSAAMDGDTEEMSDVNESSGDQNVDDQIHSTDTHSSVNDDDNDDNDGDDDDDDGEEDNDSDESSDLVDSDSDSDDMHAMLDYSSDEALDNTEEAAMQVSSLLIQSELEEVHQFLNLVSHALEVISSHVLLRSMPTGRMTSALEDLQNIVSHLLTIRSGEREE